MQPLKNVKYKKISATSGKATLGHEILELGSYNILAKHMKCSTFFFKITPPYSTYCRVKAILYRNLACSIPQWIGVPTSVFCVSIPWSPFYPFYTIFYPSNIYFLFFIHTVFFFFLSIQYLFFIFYPYNIFFFCYSHHYRML